jgi:NADH-quinone oxidoreductase subunit J
MMTIGTLVFMVLGIIAIASAIAMLLSRNTVYSALFLILNFISVAIIYLILGAPFIALSQITVYAGAIMVLFLFVIMLLGAEKLKEQEPLKWQRPLAIILASAVIIEGVYALTKHIGLLTLTVNPTAVLADPKTIAAALYLRYSLPFEVTSIILLVAAIGAVVFTKKDSNDGGTL